MTSPSQSLAQKLSGPLRQAVIYLRGLAGKRPRVPTNADELEMTARACMSQRGYAYVAGGAGTEQSMRANREAFGKWQLAPRALTDVSSRDLSVTLFGRTLSAPILLAPIGVLEMAHRDADLAVAKAAAALGVPMIFSSQGSVDMETCAAAMSASPRWFQLYWTKLEGLMESFVHRAEACGCDAIVLTIDSRLLGWRPRDLDLGTLPFLEGKGIAQFTSDPVFRASLDKPLPPSRIGKADVTLSSIASLFGAAQRFPGSTVSALASGTARRAIQQWVSTFSYPELTWGELARLRNATKLPILIKGILDPADAQRALDAGMNGVIVSNHGGRQVDHSIAALDALPVVAAAVSGKAPVLFDSGIRSGADAFLALVLGADAVLVGRPYVYGLAIAGETGVCEVIENIIAELDLTMALSGLRSVRDARGRASRRVGSSSP